MKQGASNGHTGLYLQWIYYINPVAHAVAALLPGRFTDIGRPTTVRRLLPNEHFKGTSCWGNGMNQTQCMTQTE